MASPAATLGAVPESPAGSAPPPARADTLVGQERSQQQDRESSNRGFVAIVRSIHEQLEDLARQFPAFAQFAKQAQDAVKEGMVRTLASQSRPEETGSAIPRVVG